MTRCQARQQKPRHRRIQHHRQKQTEQPRQLHPVMRRAHAAARANRPLRHYLQSTVLAIHRALSSFPVTMSREDTSPNARSLLLHLSENYWSEGQSWGSYGETCFDVTFVAVDVISKCNSQSLSTLRPSTSGEIGRASCRERV